MVDTYSTYFSFCDCIPIPEVKNYKFLLHGGLTRGLDGVIIDHAVTIQGFDWYFWMPLLLNFGHRCLLYNK